MATNQKVEVLATFYYRFEKNEDGEKVKRRYRTGDIVEVTSAKELEGMRNAQIGGRPLYRVLEDEKSSSSTGSSTSSTPKSVSTEK